MTRRIAITSVLAGLILAAGGCGNAQVQALAVDLQKSQNELILTRNQLETALNDRALAKADVKEATEAFYKTEAQRELLELQLAGVKKALQDAQKSEVASFAEVLTARNAKKEAEKAVVLAKSKLESLTKSKAALDTLNASLKKNADDVDTENKKLNETIRDLNKKIKGLEAKLAAAKAAKN